MPAVELVDPVGYSGIWTFVGVALLIAVPAWFVWVGWSTRKTADEVEEPRPPEWHQRPASGVPVSKDPWDPVRRIYLDQLSAIADRFDAGEHDHRGVHLEIRRVMREYTKARTGVDAATFTSSDAARVSLTGPLAKTLKALSYPSFAPRSVARPLRSINHARKVVSQW